MEETHPYYENSNAPIGKVKRKPCNNNLYCNFQSQMYLLIKSFIQYRQVSNF